jgi:hypothetical protein
LPHCQFVSAKRLLRRANCWTVGETNVNYASWTIDSSYNRGFVHIDFDNHNLLAAAKSLAPSTIRFGGGGNDYLSYQPYSNCNSSADNDDFVCLNTSHWNSLYNWANASGTEFIFGISYDFVKACAEKSAYVWKPDQAISMVKYIQSQKQTIWGFELGNEVNNRQKSCSTTGGQQAAAFKLFQSDVLNKLYPDKASRPHLIGPDVGFLDPELFLGDFLGNFSDLYAVTYHVYSWLQRRNYDFSMPIDNSLRDGEGWYPGMVHAKAPEAQVWAGEDGPISGGEDGTCGGKFANGSSSGNSVCGTYATVPWYANDLGSRAVLGFSQYFLWLTFAKHGMSRICECTEIMACCTAGSSRYQRQDLVGGRYGLLQISHDGEALGKTDALRINPDFWASITIEVMLEPRFENNT